MKNSKKYEDKVLTPKEFNAMKAEKKNKRKRKRNSNKNARQK